MADGYMNRPGEVTTWVLEFSNKSLADISIAAGAAADKTLHPDQADQEEGTARTLTPEQVASSEQERAQFDAKTYEYYKARNIVLKQLVDAMEILNGNDDDFVARWKQPTDSLASTYASSLGTLLSGISQPSSRALELKAKIQSPEDAFVKQLAALSVAQKWSDLRKLHRQVISMIASLRTRWDSLMSKVGDIHRAQMDTVDRLDSKLRSTLTNVNSAYLDALNAIEDAYQTLVKAAGESKLSQSRVDDILNDAGAAMDRAASPFSTMLSVAGDGLSELQAGVAKLDSFQSAEISGIHRIFLDIRKEVGDFVREPASNRGKALQDDAERMMASWVSSMNFSDGLRRDCSDFGDDVTRKPDLGLAAMFTNYATFENENRGKFFEDIDYARQDALLMFDEWAAKRQWLLTPANIDAPRFAEDMIAKYFGRPLEQAFNDFISMAKNQVDESVQATVQFQIEKARDQALSDYRSRSDSVRSVLRSLYDIMKTDQYRAYFERGQMVSSIKG